MKFQDSGLLNDKLIESAFNYSLDYTQCLHEESMIDFNQQIAAFYAKNMQVLLTAKNAGKITDEELTANQARLDELRDKQIAQGPQAVAQVINEKFALHSVAPALEIQKYSDHATPELIAAVLLIACVRSPIDHQKIEAKFGKAVGSIVAELVHLEAYPASHDANLAAAASDIKRIYMANLTASLDQVVAQAQQVAQLKAKQKIMFPPGEEEVLFGEAKVLWGNDKKLDKRLIDTFNRAAQVTASPYKMEVDAKGSLGLVKGARAPLKPRPAAPTVGPGFGDEVF